MTIPPGARRIDPDAEAERLAMQRKRDTAGQLADGPHQEWAIRHPDGTITVTASGPPFLDRDWPVAEIGAIDHRCLLCPGGKHVLMVRDVGEWREDA